MRRQGQFRKHINDLHQEGRFSSLYNIGEQVAYTIGVSQRHKAFGHCWSPPPDPQRWTCQPRRLHSLPMQPIWEQLSILLKTDFNFLIAHPFLKYCQNTRARLQPRLFTNFSCWLFPVLQVKPFPKYNQVCGERSQGKDKQVEVIVQGAHPFLSTV